MGYPVLFRCMNAFVMSNQNEPIHLLKHLSFLYGEKSINNLTVWKGETYSW